MNIWDSYDILVEILGDPSETRSQSYADRYAFDCPNCAEENGGSLDNKQNLEVNLNDQLFHCWKCQDYSDMKGSIYFLIKKYGTKDQLKKYSSFAKDYIPSSKNKNTQVTTNFDLPYYHVYFDLNSDEKELHSPYLNYLYERGMNLNQILDYKMGYCYNGKYKDCIVIPSYDKYGKLNLYLTRKIDNKLIKGENAYSLRAKEKNKFIFNENKIKWYLTIYLVEGFFDHFFIPNSIPLLGKTISEYLMNEIFKNSESDIVLVKDSDVNFTTSVEHDLKRLSTVIDEKKLYYTIPPEKDPGQIFKERGYSGIYEMFQNHTKPFSTLL